ncbi:hypothetical protein [Verrucomicrobium sp. BvORR034]|uniref:hypothetical protein n=1 Tax=Verrucomicrobium sp. BvORR034 TaxID=1396418 RepID=UPI000678DB6C|nr:hypothetical protein [Verrucomicrobium sp. BvORR034]
MDTRNPSLLEPRRHRLKPLWAITALIVTLLSVAAWLFFVQDDPTLDVARPIPTAPQHEWSNNPLATYCQTSALLGSTYLLFDPFNPLPSSQRFKLTDPKEVELLTAFQTLVASDPATWHSHSPRALPDKQTLNWWQLTQTTSFIDAKAKALGDEGQIADATRLVLSLIKLGHGLGNLESDLSNAFSSAPLHRKSVATLYELLNGRDIPVQILREALELLTQYPPTARDKFAFARRSGYFAFKESLVQTRLNGLPAGLGSYLPTGHATPPLPLIGSPLKINRTVGMYMGRGEAVLAALDQGWSEALRVEQAFEKTSTAAMPVHGTWRHYVESNAQGRIMHAFASRHAMQYLELVMTTHADFEAARINLALRLFEVDHQRLPHDLQSLVPTYLPAVPLAPFSGKPMRWNLEAATICAISSEADNERGNHTPTSPEEHERGLDFTLSYGWSASAFQQRALDNTPVPLEALPPATKP